jgi:predicted transcriptional regulator
VEARDARDGSVAYRRTMDGMVESMVEVSVGVPAELWARLEAAAADDCTSSAALLVEALSQHLSCRARLRSVSAWAWDAAGVGEFDGLAEVDPLLDVTGCA